LHKEFKDINYINLLDGISPPKPEGMGIRNVEII